MIRVDDKGIMTEQTTEEKFLELNKEDFRELSSAPRRRAREASLMLLFQIDIGKNTWETARQTLDLLGLTEDNLDFAVDLVQGVQDEIVDLDVLLVRYAREWDIDRFAGVDRSILRMSLYELLHPGDTPATIILNEAIELAKKFGAPESGPFINGILDNIYTMEIKK